MFTMLQTSRSCYSLLFSSLLLFVINESRASVTCPPACKCGPMEVRCESRTMTSIPQSMPESNMLQTLAITRGNLSILNPSSFPYLPNLTTLELHNNAIETLEDGAFQNVSQLRVLVLRRNSLKYLSDQTFLGLELLERLDLSWNRFSELHHRWFQQLESLQVLDLARNQIENVQSEAFFGLAHLNVLNLTQNRLMSSSSYLAPLTGLKLLVMDDNSFRVIENGSFFNQHNLECLSLTGNRDLTFIEANAFASQSHVLPLEELSLKGTHLLEVPVDVLKTLPSLKTLDLSQTAIRVVQGHSFSSQSSLLNLTLDSLQDLSRIEDHAFAGLSHLKRLVISNNPVLTKIAWDAFSNLTSLHLLDLHNNNLETVWLGKVDWGSIELVDLRGNPIRCDCHAGWMLTLLNQTVHAGNSSSTKPVSNATCANTSISNHHRTEISTAAFTRQIRCHMPPDLHGLCLASLTANQFRCPRVPAPRTKPQHNDRRLIVAIVSASLTCFFLLICGLVLKFRRRLCSACSQQYRYRAQRNHPVNGTNHCTDIVELETTQLEDFDSDLDTAVQP